MKACFLSVRCPGVADGVLLRIGDVSHMPQRIVFYLGDSIPVFRPHHFAVRIVLGEPLARCDWNMMDD